MKRAVVMVCVLFVGCGGSEGQREASGGEGDQRVRACASSWNDHAGSKRSMLNSAALSFGEGVQVVARSETPQCVIVTPPSNPGGAYMTSLVFTKSSLDDESPWQDKIVSPGDDLHPLTESMAANATVQMGADPAAPETGRVVLGGE